MCSSDLASDPLDKRLGEYPFRVGAGSSLVAFLDQMKGARVDLKLGAGAVTGTIVSGRVVRDADKDRTTEREILVLLMDSGDIQSFDLGAASAVKLSDPKQQSQLAAYLSLLNQARSRDRRSVYLDSAGFGTRQIQADRKSTRLNSSH